MSLPYTVIPAGETKPQAAFTFASDAFAYARLRGGQTRIKLNGIVVFKTTLDNRYAHLEREAVLEMAENYRLALAKRQARYDGYAAKHEARLTATFATTEN